MIILSSTLQKLQVVLSGAVSATEAPITGAYRDKRGNSIATEKGFNSVTTGGTAVDIVSAPPQGFQRILEYLSIYNADSAAITVTVRLNDNGTTRTLITVTLQTLEQLFYSTEKGFYCVDVNGNQKSNAPASSGASSTADSKGVSAGLAASVAVSVATSLDTADDTATSTADSKAVSAALAGSTTESKAVSLDLSASVALSTAASTSLRISVAESKLKSGGTAGF